MGGWMGGWVEEQTTEQAGLHARTRTGITPLLPKGALARRRKKSAVSKRSSSSSSSSSSSCSSSRSAARSFKGDSAMGDSMLRLVWVGGGWV